MGRISSARAYVGEKVDKYSRWFHHQRESDPLGGGDNIADIWDHCLTRYC
jgi:hypothetical protein